MATRAWPASSCSSSREALPSSSCSCSGFRRLRCRLAPFTGLDTLPSVGVVTLSLGVALEDFLVVVAALLIGVGGVTLEITVGGAALKGLGGLLSWRRASAWAA